MPAPKSSDSVEERRSRGERQVSFWAAPEMIEQMRGIKKEHGLRNSGEVLRYLLDAANGNSGPANAASGNHQPHEG